MSDLQNLKLLIGIDYLNRKYKTGLDRYYFEMFNIYSDYLNKINVFSCDNYTGDKKNNINPISLNVSRKKYFLNELMNLPFTRLDRVLKRINPNIIHLFLPIPLKKKRFQSLSQFMILLHS